MSTLVVIPARLAAARLPQKPLRLLAGVPLVARVWQRVRAMEIADRCVVATDDPAVVEVARNAGAECVLTAAHHTSGTERVAEVAEMKEFSNYETLINVQGDEPFIHRSAVQEAASLVKSGAFSIGTAATRVAWSAGADPNVVKVVCAEGGRALYFSRASIPYVRDNETIDSAGLAMLQHIGVYAYSRDGLRQWVSLPQHPLERVEKLEQLRPMARGIPIGVAVTSEPPVSGIDTEDELAVANARWHEFIEGI